VLESWKFVVVIVAAAFAGGLAVAADRVLLPLEVATRPWILVYPAGSFASIAYLVSSVTDGAWWAVAAGNAAMVLAWALVWMGMRVFHGRRPGVLPVVAIVTASALGTFWPSPLGPEWAGTEPRLALLTLVGVLAAIEVSRGRLMMLRGGRIGLALSIGHAVLSAVRLVALLVGGEAGVRFEQVVSSSFAPIVEVVCVGIGLVAIVLLHTQLRRDTDLGDLSDRAVRAPTFAARLAAAPRSAGVALVGIEFFPRIRAAYGAPQARTLHLDLLEAVRASVPAGSLLADLPDGRVGILISDGGSAAVRSAVEEARLVFADSRRADAQDIGTRMRAVVGDSAGPHVLARITAEFDRAEAAAAPEPPRRPVVGEAS